MTIKLPHHLAPWHLQLKIFPEEIALALGPLVQKVAALIGPFHHQHVEGYVVPDGFAGLAKRETYERLISSDWLLADELPDEFMRRSVMGEHLFWKLAYREPSQSRSTFVLFDAGPDQLGSPRLLHLAALAVFDARARNAKAYFQWGILQRPEQDPLPGVSAREVDTLLKARGAVSARPEHFAAWARRAPGGKEAETWVVGSSRLRELLPQTVSSLIVSDVLAPGERRLRAECRPARKHPRSIELELPPTYACAHLLRDPFLASIAPRRKLETDAAVQSLVFNPTGNKLWVRTSQDDLIVLPVPNSPRQPVGNAKHYHTLSRFPQIAVGRAGQTTVVVSTNPVSLALRVASFGKNLPIGLVEGEYEFMDSRTRPLFQPGRLSLCVWHGQAQQRGLYLLDDGGLLLRLFADEKGGRLCQTVHSHALALTRSTAGLLYAAYEHLDGHQVRVFVHNLAMPIQSWPAPRVPVQVYFGYDGSTGERNFGQFAMRMGNTHWKICTHWSPVDVPPGVTVHGVLRDRNYEETLIVVEDDLRTLSLHGAHGTRRLVKAQAAIVAASGCQQLPFIAYATATGEICVYSLKHGKAVLDFVRSPQ